MKAIILAAGQGTRLRPLTEDRPKCMVEYKGKPIIDSILDAMRACSLSDITIVKGYRADVLERPDTRSVINPAYDRTNMVHTLFCAEEELNDDVIISYADIVYKKEVLQALIEAKGDLTVVVDTKWKELWRKRMEDPLADAETMKIDQQGNITELGKKPQSEEDIQAQYIGLFKIAKEFVSQVREFYHSLDREAKYDGKDFDNMYMTSFLQLIIDRLGAARAVPIAGGWVEIDQPSDVNIDAC